MTHALIGKRVLWMCPRTNASGVGTVAEIGNAKRQAFVKWELHLPHGAPAESWVGFESLHILQTTPLTEWLKEHDDDRT